MEAKFIKVKSIYLREDHITSVESYDAVKGLTMEPMGLGVNVEMITGKCWRFQGEAALSFLRQFEGEEE